MKFCTNEFVHKYLLLLATFIVHPVKGNQPTMYIIAMTTSHQPPSPQNLVLTNFCRQTYATALTLFFVFFFVVGVNLTVHRCHTFLYDIIK